MTPNLLGAPAGQVAPDLTNRKVSFVDPNGPKAIGTSSFAANPTTTIPAANPPAAPDHTIDANAVNNNQNSSGVTFPNNTPSSSTSASNSNSANTSIPNPIPTADSIIDKGAQTTPAETKQKSILDRIAGLVVGGKGQTTLTNEAESAAGVPALTKTVNDLNTQLQGLNDQATALQNDANSTIPNQVQLDNAGSGVTKASTTARTADAMRLNQIKQGQIATQALTLKAAIYGAQGNLTLAKDAADKAATAQYEDQQQQIDYQKALLDANKDQMTKEEKAQADKVTAQLADRQTQIDNAKEDKKTVIAMATAAMKNNPDDAEAHYAAQQALAESNKDQPDLTKVFDLIGKYQADPLATQKAILDIQATRANIAQSNATTAKTIAETKALGTTSTDDTVVQGWVTAIKNGTAKISDITTNPSLKSAVAVALSQGGSSTTDILKTTQKSLQELQTMVDNNQGFSGAVGAKGFSSFFGLRGTPLPGTQAANFDAKLKQVKNDIILPNLNLLHGLGRVTDREFQALTSAVTSLSTDLSEGEFKNELSNITDRINQKIQDSGLTNNNVLMSPDGKSQVNKSDLTSAQLKEAAAAGWK